MATNDIDNTDDTNLEEDDDMDFRETGGTNLGSDDMLDPDRDSAL